MSEKKDAKDKAKEILTDVKDETNAMDAKEVSEGKGLAILSYFGLLSLIPYFVEKKNKFVRFHAVQGLNLFIVEVIYGIISTILTSTIKVSASCGAWGDFIGMTCKVTPWWIRLPLSLISLGFFALAIVGIVYACQGKAKELPVVNKVKIIKK